MSQTPMQRYSAAKMKVGSCQSDVAKITRNIMHFEDRNGYRPQKMLAQLAIAQKQLNRAKESFAVVRKEVGL